MSAPQPAMPPAGPSAASAQQGPSPAGTASAPGAPSELERRVLDFERDWTGRTGPKEAAIRADLGLTATRYYQLLHTVIENPIALAEDPLLVRRLQRLRAARTRSRAARTFHTD